MNYFDFIEVNSTMPFGKPSIKGTNITVHDILGWLSAGRTANDILNDHPELTRQHIQACIDYTISRN